MIAVDCEKLPGHLKNICLGDHVKSNGRQHSLSDRKTIIARRLRLSPDELELPVAPFIPEPKPAATGHRSSGIGVRLHAIIRRESGNDIPCGECQNAINRLDRETADQARARREEIADDIVRRARTGAKHFWQRWGATLAPGVARAKVLAWVDEAIGLAEVRSRVSRIATFMRTANREEPTLPGTLQSLSDAGFDAPIIFAEPDAPGDCTVRWPERKGSFSSFMAMCQWIIDNSQAEWLLICEDDVLFARGLRATLERQVMGNEVVTLFKPHKIRLSGDGFQRVDMINGLLAILVRREVLRHLIESGVVRSWDKHDCEDYCMGHAANEIGVPILCPVKSWVQHVGRTSVAQPAWWKENSLTHPLRYASDFVEDLYASGELMGPSISVIIPSLGRRSLRAMVDSLKPQLGPTDELIVVADGERAAERVRVAAPDVRCEVVSDRRSRYGNAQRNRGIELATGDMLWFVDDDDVAAPGAIESIRYAMRDGRPTVFSIITGGKLQSGKELSFGHIGGVQLVVPRLADLPRWPVPSSDPEASDLQWINSVRQWMDIAFSPASISQANHRRRGRL